MGIFIRYYQFYFSPNQFREGSQALTLKKPQGKSGASLLWQAPEHYLMHISDAVVALLNVGMSRVRPDNVQHKL